MYKKKLFGMLLLVLVAGVFMLQMSIQTFAEPVGPHATATSTPLSNFLPIVLNSGSTPTPTTIVATVAAPTETPSPTPTTTTLPSNHENIKISHIEYDLPDADLDGEYVDIQNIGTVAQELTSWQLHDEAGSIFTFPSFTLDAMSTVRIWVKDGTNSLSDLYWGKGWPIWNNTGDTATLLNDDSQIVDECSYTGSEVGGYKNCTSFVDKGELISLEVEHEAISAHETHEWEFEIFAEETFTVTIAGDTNADFVVSIIDENETLLVDQQNTASADNLEIAIVSDASVGFYQILVETVGNVAGYYAIAAVDADALSSLPTAYKGILEDGTR